MLVLTRKTGQSIRINNDISIMIVEVDGKCVKLGVNAPREVSIHREEIYQRIQTEKNSPIEENVTEKQIAK